MSSTIPRSRSERNPALTPGSAKRSLQLLIVSCGALFAACGDATECNIDAATRMLGGPGVIDCGIASVDDTSEISNVDRCAVETYNARGTFRAIYEQDDGGLSAVVHAAGDTYHLLRMRVDSIRIERADCLGAHVVQTDGRTYVQCDEPSRFAPVCP